VLLDPVAGLGQASGFRKLGNVVHQDSSDFAIRLRESAQAVNGALETLLAPQPLDFEVLRPPRLLAAMRHATLNGGKRLRPFLTLETARLFGLNSSLAMNGACAIELVHCYSLVHDDLPAMDDDDLRRGNPTVHKAFDEATAILAGDALLTLAFDVMAREQTHHDAMVRSGLVLGLARAAGLGGMAGGQMLDLEAETSQGWEQEAVVTMQAMKTGALLQFAVEAGALIAGAGREERHAIKRYGAALGAAFQIADDILDAQGDSARLGKAAGKDADRNKATLVGTLGLGKAQAICAQKVEDALAALAPFGARAHVLAAAVKFTAARDH